MALAFLLPNLWVEPSENGICRGSENPVIGEWHDAQLTPAGSDNEVSKKISLPIIAESESPLLLRLNSSSDEK